MDTLLEQNILFDELEFPQLAEDAKLDLENNLSIEELVDAVQSMNSGKAPEPDGLPVEIYKTFSKRLMPYLLEMYTESYETGILPPSLRSALITLVLKPGKSPTDRASYRPISLMSCDTKILCKALAKRIQIHIPKIILDDQNGFVLGRQAFNNTRRVLNVLYKNLNAKDHAILSSDAEKAFDRIEWNYLFETLRRFGLGTKYLKWLQLLYNEPRTQVITNSNISKLFNLARGTRQGCPLSPLLFLFAIEPLAMTIRKSPCIKDMKIGERDHRISLFADDIVLFLTNLKNTIPALINIMGKFVRFSGYKINNSKSILLLLNDQERKAPSSHTQFTNESGGFSYLGIKIMPNIVPTNYDPLLKGVMESLDKWSTMPISLVGRINIIKMSILPKFLYLFQSIPLPLPNTFLSTLKKAFTRFILNNKQPWLRLSLLYLPYDRGGLQVPNIKLYYWAAHLRTARFYFSTDHPSWVDIEKEELSLPLQSYIYSAEVKILKLKRVKITLNPFLKNTLSVWHEAHSFLEETISISPFSPIWGNNYFIPGRNYMGFKNWQMKGLSMVENLYEGGTLMTFQQLVTKYNLPKKHFFKYLQIRSYIYSRIKAYSKTPTLYFRTNYFKSHEG